MTITTAEYKAAIEAKIAAANGATALKDLTLIKTNADLWLLNNSGGSITGYASLESLIQDKQDDLTVSSTLNDVSFVGVAAFPSQAANSSSGGFKNKVQITSSGTWTVPADTHEVELWGTAGGGSGGGTPDITGVANGGGAAGATAIVKMPVIPGQVLSIVIGAGGIGNTGGIGNAGGSTSVTLGAIPVATVTGGQGGNTSGSSSGGSTVASLFHASGAIGGNGGARGGNGVSGASGTNPLVFGANPANTTAFSGVTPASGGSAGTQRFAGGGGGSSIYGAGGPGQSGLNTLGPAVAGNNAPSTSYGAGGGAASGGTTSQAVGGNGANGIVEIYY